MRSLILASVTVVILSGCNAAVSDFVGSGPPNPGGAPPVTPIPIGATGPIKFSPGHFASTSSGGQIKATLSPTRQTLTSAEGQLRLSFSRRRFSTP